MKPIFDAIAQAAGIACSYTYDEYGRWRHAQHI
jgi:hypothetical protein